METTDNMEVQDSSNKKTIETVEKESSNLSVRKSFTAATVSQFLLSSFLTSLKLPRKGITGIRSVSVS